MFAKSVLDTSFMDAVAADMVIVGSSVVRKDCATVLCAPYRVNKRKSVAGDVPRFCSPLYIRMNSFLTSSNARFGKLGLLAAVAQADEPSETKGDVAVRRGLCRPRQK